MSIIDEAREIIEAEQANQDAIEGIDKSWRNLTADEILARRDFQSDENDKQTALRMGVCNDSAKEEADDETQQVEAQENINGCSIGLVLALCIAAYYLVAAVMGW